MSSWRQLVEAWDDVGADVSHTQKPQYLQNLSAEPSIADIADNADTQSGRSSHVSEDTVHGIPIRELHAEAGDDWPGLVADKNQLDAFADTLQITRMRERGEVPSHYTSTTDCKRCGTVPIFEGLPDKVEGCPWCFNRLKELNMPAVEESLCT